MDRNFGSEIDNLKKELEDIKLLLLTSSQNKKNKREKQAGHIQKMNIMHPDPNIMKILDKLENACGKTGESGAITYLGVFESGGRQSSWIRNEVSTNNLLSLIEDKMAVKVLNCIGNNDRLNILRAILLNPMTVTQLVEQCGYNTTGQVYHHLKPLISADLIREDEQNRGVYIIQPHRVQGIIMLLAGISDMLDPKYTQGNWENVE